MKLKLEFFIFLSIVIDFSSAYEKGIHKGVCGENYHLNETVSCDKIFNIFHKCAGIFIEVALKNTNPFNLCTNYHSYQSYKNLTLFFNLLQTSQDPKNHNVTCSEEYMNKNSMGVISKIVELSNSLWENANCEDCYVNTSSVSQNFSQNTKEFLSLRDKYKNCTENKTNTSQICTDCEEWYSQMNIIFNHHKEKGGIICFDLEDIMNKTRLEWSTTYKCCKDKKDSLIAFYSLFSTILTVALFFYGSIYCTGSRYSVVETIDAHQIGHNIANVSASSSSTASASSSSSGSNKNIKGKKSPKKMSINNDDSEDDETIINNSINSNNLIQLAD